MSMKDYEKALELIDDLGSGDFEGPKPKVLVNKAESALNVKFPPSYRRFLLEMGCGDVEGIEIFGLIDDNFESSSIPNGIWMTFEQRKLIGLSESLVIIGEDGDGGLHAIDTSQPSPDGEGVVVRLSVDGKSGEKMADSFGSYLLKRVESVA